MELDENGINGKILWQRKTIFRFAILHRASVMPLIFACHYFSSRPHNLGEDYHLDESSRSDDGSKR